MQSVQYNARLRQAAEAFIAAANAGDVAQVPALFTPDAVIDDPSTGHRVDGHVGIGVSMVSRRAICPIISVGAGPLTRNAFIPRRPCSRRRSGSSTANVDSANADSAIYNWGIPIHTGIL